MFLKPFSGFSKQKPWNGVNEVLTFGQIWLQVLDNFFKYEREKFNQDIIFTWIPTSRCC